MVTGTVELLQEWSPATCAHSVWLQVLLNSCKSGLQPLAHTQYGYRNCRTLARVVSCNLHSLSMATGTVELLQEWSPATCAHSVWLQVLLNSCKSGLRQLAHTQYGYRNCRTLARVVSGHLSTLSMVTRTAKLLQEWSPATCAHSV